MNLNSYELPYRIHTTKVYPIRALNGSTVILYGHENGVKLVWRGGRPFKNSLDSNSASQKTNGTKKAVISLDSDDEGDSGKNFEDKPEFEDEEGELDPLRPYPDILQELDLYFGTDVLDLAVLPGPILKDDRPSWRGPDHIKQKMIFAIACADNTVRLVTLPLAPPSPKSKARPELLSDFTLAAPGNGSWGEKVVVLNGHLKPSDGVSMTLEFVNNPNKTPGEEGESVEPYIIVASHSREVTGRLLLFRASIKLPKPALDPFQSVYLASPAKTISFKPTLHKQHASHLLVADSIGVCRIYDYKTSSDITEDSTDNPVLEQGTWLLSLYTGFQSARSDSQTPQIGTHTGFGRKIIVDAQWVLSGRGVIVLLSDGEWAIWDIEGIGPGTSQSLLSRHGIKGGSRSEYSLTGFIDATPKSRTSGAPQPTTSKFAPMTPGTRKSIDPFASRGANSFVRGQISVLDVPSTSPTRAADESVLFWLGETFMLLPHLAKYWAANVGKKSGASSFFTGTSGSRALRIENVELQGERCSAVTQIPSSTGLQVDIVIVAEHRFVILSTPVATAKPTRQNDTRLVLADKNTNRGELDVVGIEQALARMENGNGASRKLF